ncbi:MAG: glutamate cyclase domain-containing protein, partial [Ktedonobacteraceae bacterium]
MEDSIDRLVNIDLAQRGIAYLYAAARAKIGIPLALAAAKKLADIRPNSVVLFTTGSASRAWISPTIAENDGPAGAAVVARVLSLAFNAIPVVLCEQALHAPIGAIFQAAGMSVLTLEEARRTYLPGGRLSVAVLQDYPIEDEAAQARASVLLDELQPTLLFATERPGMNELGIYHNARGVDYGQGKARIDYVFREASRRNIPSIGVGDGGNEIGMGLIADAVKQYVPWGEQCNCGCGAGIGAATATDVLMTATVSNWGCYAIVACLAILLKQPELLHTPEQEELLLRRGVELGLINSPQGRVDPHVDAIPLSTH